MPEYKAPLRDMRFLLHEVFDIADHYRRTGYPEVGAEDVDAVLSEGAKFCEEVIAPLNASGDAEGCHWEGGKVTTPKGYREAYAAYREAQWGSISSDPEYGGQGLPQSLELFFNEMAVTASTSFRLASGLSMGAVHVLEQHGTDAQKRTYLPKLISSEWTGTMCLTEPHAGSDVGILTTSATPDGDDAYRIQGTKIFITYGEHDLADNIVHLVLARLPDAARGAKGISLFLVPKFLPGPDGSPGEPNGVHCASIEHKLGIHGSPTCVLNFDNAKGFLVGPPHGGLRCMFTMMNYARIDVGMHGLGQAERAFQGSVAYARERLQFRAPDGPVLPDKRADPIIVHPDVRRMLLTQKAVSEGCRALSYLAAMQLDVEHRHEDADARQAGGELLAFLIPITKGMLTEAGFEAANSGIQVFGGYGYIRETGMDQYMRDCRITSIYEGTNAIQANDLLGRKVLGSDGALLRRFGALIDELCDATQGDSPVAPLSKQLRAVNADWQALALRIGGRVADSKAELGAAAFDFLMYSGYTALGYLWLRMGHVAATRLAEGAADRAFYEAKIKTARFYFARLLPRTAAHSAAIDSGADNLLALAESDFIL